MENTATQLGYIHTKSFTPGRLHRHLTHHNTAQNTDHLTTSLPPPPPPPSLSPPHSLLFICTISLGNFPILNEETEGDVLNSAYVHGTLDFGSFSRMVFVRPLKMTKYAELSNTENQQKDREAIISQRICVLPGLADISKFKEDISTRTFTLQIHRENIDLRTFTKRKSEEYRELVVSEKSQVITLSMTKSDVYLVQCVGTALEESSKTMVSRIHADNFT
jgi:hypothetical protein